MNANTRLVKLTSATNWRWRPRYKQRLFPRVLPAAPGLDYAGICRPARGVSGDYYDFLALGGGKLGLLLADVSGKGMPAALVGASLHAAVRAQASSASDRCGELLAKASCALFETTMADRFATVFYTVYDSVSRTLTYANAGHPPPMLVRQGTAMRLECLTPPGGIFAGLPARQNRAQLLPGDWLLIFSDGVTEAADARGEEFADNRLLAALARHNGRTAAQVCEGVANEVRDHLREQRQPDDITLIAAHVL